MIHVSYEVLNILIWSSYVPSSGEEAGSGTTNCCRLKHKELKKWWIVGSKVQVKYKTLACLVGVYKVIIKFLWRQPILFHILYIKRKGSFGRVAGSLIKAFPLFKQCKQKFRSLFLLVRILREKSNTSFRNLGVLIRMWAPNNGEAWY